MNKRDCPACGAAHEGPFPCNCEACGEQIDAPPKHVIGLSGGKDSVALATVLRLAEPRQYEYICNETGNELDEWRRHIDRLEVLLDAPIKRVRYRTDLLGLIREMQMLPNFRARFCTRMLKIEPTIEYFESLPKGSVLYVGLRADEEMRKGLYGEDIDVRFPLREWGWAVADVWRWLNDSGICIPARTDCAWCPYQRLSEWRNLYVNEPALYWEGAEVEREFGHTFRSPGRDTWPASLVELAAEFDRGRPILKRKNDSEPCRVCTF